MTGTLGLFSLVDLFQLLSSSSRTGRLVVDHPGGLARVYFDAGRVIHAEFDRLQGEEAVYALFSDERGNFEFLLGLPAPRQTITTSTENLLLESIRRLDENRRDTEHDPPEELVPEQAVPAFAEETPGTERINFRPPELAVLRLVDGQRRVSQIVELADIPAKEVRRTVSHLVRLGVLVLRARKPRVARLVAQLARRTLAPRTAGVDRSIVSNWQRVMGVTPERVACRRPDGRVDVYRLVPIEGAGAYILFSADTLFASNLAANTPLLTKPLADTTKTQTEME